MGDDDHDTVLLFCFFVFFFLLLTGAIVYTAVAARPFKSLLISPPKKKLGVPFLFESPPLLNLKTIKSTLITLSAVYIIRSISHRLQMDLSVHFVFRSEQFWGLVYFCER